MTVLIQENSRNSTNCTQINNYYISLGQRSVKYPQWQSILYSKEQDFQADLYKHKYKHVPQQGGV